MSLDFDVVDQPIQDVGNGMLDEPKGRKEFARFNRFATFQSVKQYQLVQPRLIMRETITPGFRYAAFTEADSSVWIVHTADASDSYYVYVSFDEA